MRTANAMHCTDNGQWTTNIPSSKSLRSIDLPYIKSTDNIRKIMHSNNTNSSLGSDEREASSSAAAATSSSSSSSSWQTLRMIGREHYDNGEYDAAFYAFHNAYTKMKQQQSLNRISNEELQFMLSNVIACRLQIGGSTHLQTAIEESKECIAINPTWSKAYIRLASSYMALRTYDSQRRGTSNENHTVNNYSNDICNALQTAIRYDTNHTTKAKQMLLQELRLRNQNQNGSAIDQNNSTIRSSGTNPPPMNPNYIPPTNSVHNSSSSETTPLEGFGDHESDNHGNATFRGGPPIWSDLSEHCTRLFRSIRNSVNASLQQLQVRYLSLPNHQRQGLACLLVLLLLLVIFSLDPSFATGGHSRPRKMKGNYGNNNIYEQIRQEKLQQQQSERQYYYNSQPHHHVPPNHQQRYPPPHESYHHQDQDHYARTTTRASRSLSSSSFEVNGILYMALIAGAVYIGHTYFGINPWQMIMLLRMANGAGGGFMWYGGAGGRGRHPYRRRGYW